MIAEESLLTKLSGSLLYCVLSYHDYEVTVVLPLCLNVRICSV